MSERKLTDQWLAAGRSIYALDPELANACKMKGLGWTDPDVWVQADKMGLKIGIRDMQDARVALNQVDFDRRLVTPSTILPSPARIHAGNPVLLVTLALSGVFGLGCIYSGIQLMPISAEGKQYLTF